LVSADASPPTAPEDAYEVERLRGEPPSVYELVWTGTRTAGPGRLTVPGVPAPGARRVVVVPPAERSTPVVEPAEFGAELANGVVGAA
jgi:hypothetical protein